uniref:Uncharacterized protein n=1 Tax=Oryza punctata TaxID=4537 RepID=A0A0E0LGS6_ORYPU
ECNVRPSPLTSPGCLAYPSRAAHSPAAAAAGIARVRHRRPSPAFAGVLNDVEQSRRRRRRRSEGSTRRKRQREEQALGGASYAQDEAAELNEAQEDASPREEAALVGVRRQQTEEPVLGRASNAQDEAAELSGAQENAPPREEVAAQILEPQPGVPLEDGDDHQDVESQGLPDSAT